MKKTDLIKVVYTEDELNAANAGLSQLEALAKKFAPDLSSEDRNSLGKIKEINKLFVNKSKTLMEQNANFIPSFIDLDEFNRDFAARKTIEDMLMRLERISRNLSDIKIMLDNDNYHDCLAFYRAIRYWSVEQQEGAIAVHNQLKVFFPNVKG